MFTRREFVKRAALFSGAAGLWGTLPAAIERAAAIEPDAGSSFLDAEHIVILMQENRSFDHAFGSLQGVRGFNDPRAISLPNGNPVWVQTNAAGESYTPFRLDIKDTSATWMGSLPHGRTDQFDARNHGKYDQWLEAKRPGHAEYAAMPLTMGFYSREDIPFYYALADAFTICDQHFCSVLTSTTPNRLYLWSGTIREEQTAKSRAHIRNNEADYESPVQWATFPERLEDLGISWRIYQNELSVATGLNGEEDNWLGNFTDNPIEFMSHFQVQFLPTHRAYLAKQADSLTSDIAALEQQAKSNSDSAAIRKQITQKQAALKQIEVQRARWSQENFDKLSPREKNLFAKAFCTNVGDPDYRQLAELTYQDNDQERRLNVPKGDVLHQFRADCEKGMLPTVSWLVAPEKFSDHPSSAWFGAWYISEVLDILTKNPEVWKKTVFILTYDENDGYFDHVPPFVPPHPQRPETGLVSPGIDAALENVELKQDMERTSASEAREGPIGLGYRVPMVIASPWTRGGCVCSQVFDHTSPLQFLERYLSHKTGVKVEEPNISQWRRAVCGDLTSVFQTGTSGGITNLPVLERDAFVEEIHRAKFKPLPAGYKRLTQQDIEQLRTDSRAFAGMPQQEQGVRRSCALPYQLVVDGRLNSERTHFVMHLAAQDDLFKERTAGAAFIVYALTRSGDVAVRNYALEPGAKLQDSWAIDDFENGIYHLRVYGPNGFFREFTGDRNDPAIDIQLGYQRKVANDAALSGNVEIQVVSSDGKKSEIEFRDNAYQKGDWQRAETAPGKQNALIDTQGSFGWYDLSVRPGGQVRCEKRYAGRVETGRWTYSDPAMGFGTRAS